MYNRSPLHDAVCFASLDSTACLLCLGKTQSWSGKLRTVLTLAMIAALPEQMPPWRKQKEHTHVNALLRD
ncbi:MAG: hypothetical protein ACI4TM_11250 [Candidatus Cryptobacteroides sp.]